MKKQERLAIVVSVFNSEITDKLLQGAQQRIGELNLPEEAIKIIKVPGAIEIPLIAKLLAKKKKYDAIICLGAVIRGDTDHYDYVCQQVSQGCMQVMLEYSVPVIFGVLTTHTEAQALERVGGIHGHKGIEAVDAAMDMIRIMQELKLDHKEFLSL